MKRIIFFIETKWAFGTIHHSLMKYLWGIGINAEVLDWERKYSPSEIQMIDKTIHCWCTTPVGAIWLGQYGIPPERIVAVAHGEWDILLTKENAGLEFFDKLKEYVVISNILSIKSSDFGIKRIPKIARLGIETGRFSKIDSSKELKTIGYAGALTTQNFTGQEIKRGYIVKEVCDQTNTPLLLPGVINYLAMPYYYQHVDCVICSSLEEGGGLPMMEAAASGRLPIGTPVGYFYSEKHKSNFAGGIITNNLENSESLKYEFLQYITELKSDSNKFSQLCEKAREYAIYNYDWKDRAYEWFDVLYY